MSDQRNRLGPPDEVVRACVKALREPVTGERAPRRPTWDAAQRRERPNA